MVIEGKLHLKKDTVQVSETFTRREFVVEYVSNPLYPQLVSFELVKDKVSDIDKFEIGEKIEVTFNLKGREWTSPQGEVKYFNTLEAWRISKVTATEGEAPTHGATMGADIASDSSDDLPF